MAKAALHRVGTPLARVAAALTWQTTGLNRILRILSGRKERILERILERAQSVRILECPQCGCSRGSDAGAFNWRHRWWHELRDQNSWRLCPRPTEITPRNNTYVCHWRLLDQSGVQENKTVT